jgi:catechol 2,3-dioxygenase-like lactoylglutathione lyase family enzyme
MAIVPVLKCTAIDRSLTHYTGVLDFDLVGVWPGRADPAYALLIRQGEELHLSTHAGDGVTGQSVLVLVEDVDAVYTAVTTRGHDASRRTESPLHQSPVDQTWGAREWAVDDPDGNKVVFVQRPS